MAKRSWGARVRKFSDTWANNLHYTSNGQEDWRDSQVTGLVLRIGKKSKTFYLAITKGPKKGMRKLAPFSLNAGGMNVEKARSTAADILKETTGKTPIHNTLKLTLGRYLDEEYMEDREYSGNPVREETIEKIKKVYASMLDTPLENITDDHMKKMLAKKWKKNNTETKRKKYYYLAALFNCLEKLEKIHKSPIKKRSFKRTKPGVINTYDQLYDDVLEFILVTPRNRKTKYTKDHTRAARLYLASVIITGCRHGEIRKNTIDNFHTGVDKPQIYIPGEICKTGNEREVPISNELYLHHLEIYKNEHWVKNRDRLMFYNQATSSVYTDSLGRKLWQEVKDHFGISGRSYDWRHTFATRVYKETGDIKLVADLIGDEIETANKYYAKKDPERMRMAVASIR
ncbi:tyrosine-type recombinase/integrase [Pontibacterium sp.]|uniref:tyrosine-type recombinase/integrase n=1 Tax=Pontibacterium sp. TaxID=2036026 RepID=UPI003514F7E5